VEKTSAQAGLIPDKKYFRIGEVGKLVGVDPHVLRYWETEFSIIRPHRGKSKQRLYRQRDVRNLLRIKVLLHDEGYTISGARKVLKTDRQRVPLSADIYGTQEESTTNKNKSQGKLSVIKKELLAILRQVDRRDGKGL